jgi:hypothetical protein
MNFKEIPGNFNDAPPNFREINETEFCNSEFFVYTSIHTESRQIILDRNKNYIYFLNVKLFLLSNGYGFGISADYKNKKIKYYKFEICQHEFREPTEDEYNKFHLIKGMCIHNSICKKCGYIKSIDSSG